MNDGVGFQSTDEFTAEYQWTADCGGLSVDELALVFFVLVFVGFVLLAVLCFNF